MDRQTGENRQNEPATTRGSESGLERLVMTPTRRGEWKTAFFCVACCREMTQHQKMYSLGRCPFCGYKGQNAGTIVDTTEKAKRFVRTAPWWKFWGQVGHWEFGP